MTSLLASKWASNPEDVVVAGGEYSAYHWAKKAILDENKYLIQANGVVDCGLITEQVR